jgi:predicted Zn-dependent protease with MMP-like domain
MEEYERMQKNKVSRNKRAGSYFKKLVEEGIGLVPKKFLAMLENVAIVVEDEPTAEQKRKLKLKKGDFLFGLYEGVPQTRRGPNYGMVLPDKITIFKKPILNYADSEEEVRQIVKNTVWHEIAHHFGSSEESVRLAETRRRKNNLRRIQNEKPPRNSAGELPI